MDNLLEKYQRLIEALDEGDFELTGWEASFLESLLEKMEDDSRPFWLSPKQMAVLDRMEKHHLP